MKKRIGKTTVATLLLAALFAFTLSITLSAGNDDPNPNASAKATARCGNINILVADASTDWDTIMAATIKCANKKDLFIDVSLQTGLYTRTNVKSKGGNKETAGAKAEVAVRVLIDSDDNVAAPGSVIFASRQQELSAKLEGMIADCLYTNMDPDDPDYGKVILDPNCVTPEEIQLLLNTMSANSFNFIAEDLEPGIHTVMVQAKIITDTYIDIDGAVNVDTLKTLENIEARASIGMGSVTIEEVRSIKNDTITELGL